MVEHFYGAALEDVFNFVVLHYLIGFSLLFVRQSETVNSVDLYSLSDVWSFFDDIFSELIWFIVGIDIVEVDDFAGSIEGESDEFMIGEVGSEAESIDHHEMQILWRLFRTFEGIVHERTCRD